MFPDYKGIRDLLSRTCCMARDFLLEEIYHDAEAEELAEEWGTTPQHVRNILQNDMIPMELLTLLQFAQLQFGIAIRDPGSGKEVTFFAANNIVEGDESDVDQTTEQIVAYNGTDKRRGGESNGGIPETIPRVHAVVDGSYTIEGPSGHPGQDNNPFGTDTIEADFEEVALGDTQDLANLCEFCFSRERIPDSQLCHYCLEAGMVCGPPNNPNEPESNPLELLAQVSSQAEEAHQKSTRLLSLVSGIGSSNDEEEQ